MSRRIADFVDQLRQQFPALARQIGGSPAVFFDGPAGTQVPQRVIDSISNYLVRTNANHGGVFATSVESDALLDEAHRAIADFLGASDPATVFFGQNMTSLTFAMSRTLSRRWKAGDEVIVTRLDHDANVSPWVLAARDVGAVVKYVEIRREDCTLDLGSLQSALSPRTKLVAVGCASNATGTINPVQQICAWAHQVGALTFLDAVHFAPHASINVHELGCDFLACSAYKFFGPHVGIMWGKRELLEELPAYKVRPATNELPGKWMSGTQNHEGICGVLAAIDYLADLGRMLSHSDAPASQQEATERGPSSGRQDSQRRKALMAAFAGIRDYESALVRRLLAGLAELPDLKVWGIVDSKRLHERLPTLSITHSRYSATELATRLAERGIFVWHGNYYALQLTETLGLEPQGMVRIGLVHYNTADEVDRLLTQLRELS
jgi:cysteine desulfurase family protein (TIGR01976 family)